MLELQIEYFATVREQAGRAGERLATSARTPQELYAELSERHGFDLEPERLRVAINDAFSEWTRPLENGDRVVFIPPVAGG